MKKEGIREIFIKKKKKNYLKGFKLITITVSIY